MNKLMILGLLLVAIVVFLFTYKIEGYAHCRSGSVLDEAPKNKDRPCVAPKNNRGMCFRGFSMRSDGKCEGPLVG